MIKRAYAISIGAALVAGLLTAPGLSSPVAGAPPGAVTGVLLDATGQPADGAEVQLAAVPTTLNEAGMIVPVTFATTTTDGQGSFALDGSPAKMTGLLQENGAVELLVTGIVEDQSVMYSLLADPPTSSGDLWSVQGTEQSFTPLRLQIGAGEVSGAALPGISTNTSAETAPPEMIHTDDLADEALDPTPAVTSGASTCKDGYAMTFVPTDKYRRRFVPIQRITTKDHSKQTYEFESTNQTKLERAHTGAGGNYAAGLVYSETQEGGLGMKLTLGNNKSKVLFPEWRYRKWRYKCYGGPPAGTHSYWLDMYLWRPTNFTSGSTDENNSPSWSCDGSTTVQMSTETWVARSSSVVWSAYFQIGTVKLRDSQSNSSAHKLTVFPNAGEADPKICGDNGFPNSANRVKERG